MDKWEAYKRIGTPEEIAEIGKPDEIKALFNRFNATIGALHAKLAPYTKLGTVDELREAIEKREAKEPYMWGDGYADGKIVYDMYDCPNCGESYEIDGGKYAYCPNCGQAIDWWEEHHDKC